MTTESSFLTQLLRELRARIAEIDLERDAIAAALVALDPSSISKGRRQVSASTVLSVVRADPGTRASMIALQLSVPAEAVLIHLRQLQEGGFVRKRGLGWDAT